MHVPLEWGPVCCITGSTVDVVQQVRTASLHAEHSNEQRATWVAKDARGACGH
jgi:hypothetical protein